MESGHSSHGDAASVAEYLGITAESVRLDSQAKYAVVARSSEMSDWSSSPSNSLKIGDLVARSVGASHYAISATSNQD